MKEEFVIVGCVALVAGLICLAAGEYPVSTVLLLTGAGALSVRKIMGD